VSGTTLQAGGKGARAQLWEDGTGQEGTGRAKVVRG